MANKKLPGNFTRLLANLPASGNANASWAAEGLRLLQRFLKITDPNARASAIEMCVSPGSSPLNFVVTFPLLTAVFCPTGSEGWTIFVPALPQAERRAPAARAAAVRPSAYRAQATNSSGVLPNVSDPFVYFADDNSTVHKRLRELAQSAIVESYGEMTVVTRR